MCHFVERERLSLLGTFVPRVSRLWNGLPSAVFDDVDLVRFKSLVNSFLLLLT